MFKPPFVSLNIFSTVIISLVDFVLQGAKLKRATLMGKTRGAWHGVAESRCHDSVESFSDSSSSTNRIASFTAALNLSFFLIFLAKAMLKTLHLPSAQVFIG